MHVKYPVTDSNLEFFRCLLHDMACFTVPKGTTQHAVLKGCRTDLEIILSSWYFRLL